MTCYLNDTVLTQTPEDIRAGHVYMADGFMRVGAERGCRVHGGAGTREREGAGHSGW